MRVSGDRAAFWGCGFFGAQDTLHDDQNRHYFKECLIQGSIDFIFGDARSLHEVILVISVSSRAKQLYELLTLSFLLSSSFRTAHFTAWRKNCPKGSAPSTARSLHKAGVSPTTTPASPSLGARSEEAAGSYSAGHGRRIRVSSSRTPTCRRPS